MSRKDFVDQLEALGYKVESSNPPNFPPNMLVFDYVIEVGSKTGQKIKMAFIVNEDFPLNPPSGPFISPKLLPIHPPQEASNPLAAVHDRPDMGPDWEYLSRPFQTWNTTDKTVRTYMTYIRRLFVDF
jgi:hypothetical protein